MTEAARFREQVLPEVEKRWGVRLTYTDLIAAATAAALTEIPALNATLEGDLIRQILAQSTWASPWRWRMG